MITDFRQAGVEDFDSRVKDPSGEAVALDVKRERDVRNPPVAVIRERKAWLTESQLT